MMVLPRGDCVTPVPIRNSSPIYRNAQTSDIYTDAQENTEDGHVAPCITNNSPHSSHKPLNFRLFQAQIVDSQLQSIPLEDVMEEQWSYVKAFMENLTAILELFPPKNEKFVEELRSKEIHAAHKLKNLKNERKDYFKELQANDMKNLKNCNLKTHNYSKQQLNSLNRNKKY